MRFLLVVLLGLAVVGCSDDDDEPRAAGTSTSTSDAAESCEGADPVPPTAADGSPAEIVAATDEISFAVVDRGASVDVVSLFATVDCAFEPVRLGGAAAALAVGGSVTHGDGIRCEGDRITVLTATSDDGATYQATAVTYEVDGTELIEVGREAATIEAQDDPGNLAPYYELDC